jgi:hypothetical protein
MNAGRPAFLLRARPSRVTPGFVMRHGAAQILRDDQERLLRQVGGSKSVLADEKCGARVLAGNVEKQSLLVACYKTPGRAPLRILRPSQNVELGADLAFAGDDYVSQLDVEVFAVHPGQGAAFVDLRNEALRDVGDGRLVLSVHGRMALVRHGARLLGVAVPTKPTAPLVQRVLVEGLAPISDLLLGAAHIVIDGYVIERATGRVLGRVQKPALAVDTRGRVLVSAHAPDSDEQMHGPLRYEFPR